MKRIELTFEDAPPVEVTISPVPYSAYFDFLERWARNSTIEEFRAEVADFVKLAQPSSNGTAFEDLDYAHVKAVINDWASKVKEVPLPLPVGPSGQPPSPEPSTATPANRSKRRQS